MLFELEADFLKGEYKGGLVQIVPSLFYKRSFYYQETTGPHRAAKDFERFTGRKSRKVKR